MNINIYKSCIIAHITKIVSLTDDETDYVFSLFEIEKFNKGELLFRENQVLDKHYFIYNGLLKLFFIDKDAKEHIIGFAIEDWWENDFEAFYKRKPTTMCLQAMEHTEVLSITYTNYLKLITQLPKIEHFFLEKAYNGFIAAQKRIVSSLTSNASERYSQLIKQHPQWLQRIPKSQLALYLGVSRETLSRLNKK